MKKLAALIDGREFRINSVNSKSKTVRCKSNSTRRTLTTVIKKEEEPQETAGKVADSEKQCNAEGCLGRFPSEI